MQHILESEKTEKLTQGNLIYEGSRWKILIIEAAAHEAWQIGLKLNEQLNLWPSQVHLLYNYSLASNLKPKIAAEKAFGVEKQFPSSASSFTISAKSDKGLKKKLSSILSRKRL
uniref:Uncharacterized protein n=1 Tax=Meloidogyne enterolobii TaxID=390850 RepID=A0A6V7UXQ5_MELEN|nr:unnamed protein product [Meloidogyne enterolobii]